MSGPQSGRDPDPAAPAWERIAGTVSLGAPGRRRRISGSAL